LQYLYIIVFKTQPKHGCCYFVSLLMCRYSEENWL